MAIIRTTSKPSCPLCGSIGSVCHEQLHDLLFAATGEWSFRRCCNESCAALWLDPAPTPDDLHLAYERYYTHGEPTQPIWRSVARYGFRAMSASLQALAGGAAERIGGKLMYIGDLKPGSLLDVGCGEGKFLGEMASRGWAVAGIDFDPAAVEAAKRAGLNVRTGTLADVVNTGCKFDVVTASHVIEHVPDPIEFLTLAGKVLKQDGRIVIRTPNANSFGHETYGRSWRGLEPPRHLQVLTVAALKSCAIKAGLAVEQCFTTAVGAEFILLSSHLLRLKEQRHRNPTVFEQLALKVLGPFLALRAGRHLSRDMESGEEICAILTNAAR